MHHGKLLLGSALFRWSGPYLKRMIESVKATHPSTPLTLYANGSGGLLERLGATGADVVGLDWTVDMADARQRLGSKSVQVSLHLDDLLLLIDPAAHFRMSCAQCRSSHHPATCLLHSFPTPVVILCTGYQYRSCCHALCRLAHRDWLTCHITLKWSITSSGAFIFPGTQAQYARHMCSCCVCSR